MHRYEHQPPMGGRVLFSVGSIILSFFAAVALLLTANFLTNLYADDGFAGVVRLRLHAVFYWRTLLILALSSIIYTPFSYGVSFLFLRHARGQSVRVGQLFFAFGAPRFLCKAIGLKICVSVAATFLGIFVLLFVCILQGCLLFPILLWQDVDLFSGEGAWFGKLAQLFSDQQWFAVMTLFLWIITVLSLVFIRIRFILCKFALLRYPSFTIIEAFKVGLVATKGKVRYVIWRYIRLSAYYLLQVLSFGFLGKKMRRFMPMPFSLWAFCQIDGAREKYFTEKNS